MSRPALSILAILTLLFGGIALSVPTPARAEVGQDCSAELFCEAGERCTNIDASGNGVCLRTCVAPDDTAGVCGATETCVPISPDDPDAGVCQANSPSTPSGNGGSGGSAVPSGGSAGGLGSDNLGSARGGKFGLSALQGTNLYQGAPETIVLNIIRQVFFFIGALLVALIVYGGITYMLSAGNDKRVQTAKQVITAAIIGAIITFAAYLIAELVIRALSTT